MTKANTSATQQQDRITNLSAILPEDRERMLDLPKDDDASLIGKRGPHLWRRGDPAEERRKAQRRGRADKCR